MQDEKPTHTQTTKRRILCIEDEHFIGELYLRALTRAGYDAKIIIDGEEGLKEVLTDTYDVILLDIMIPTITGFDILDTLRGKLAAVPVRAKIIVTTNLEQAEEDRARVENQADGYLIKAEVTPKELVSYIDRLKLQPE